MEEKLKKYVRVIATNSYYDLSERYSINEIFNYVIDLNDHNMMKLYDVKNEPIYIRASMIEAIEVITERYLIR